jgi:retron-type reverse transcriptase
MEMFIASQTAESLGANLRLLEMILDRRNMLLALKQVRSNKGAPGIDKITVNQIGGYLIRHWTKIRAALLDGSHKPLPVRRKQIDKPDGGVRLIGIPTVLDRIIQPSIAQVVEQIWDPTFSEFSYGFRPGRSAHDAVLQSKWYLLDGYTYVVDIDLSKFLGQG